VACDNCDRLRAEIRELKEEIAEWARVNRDDRLAEKIRIRFCMTLQESCASAAMMGRPDMTFSIDRLCEHMGYDGLEDGRSVVRTVLSRVRAKLKSHGLQVSVRNLHSEGYYITRADADAIKAAI